MGEQTDKHGRSEGHFFPLRKNCLNRIFFIYAPIWLQIILLGPQWPKDTKYVLRFDVGHREVGQKNERTDRQTYPVRDFNIDGTLIPQHYGRFCKFSSQNCLK